MMYAKLFFGLKYDDDFPQQVSFVTSLAGKTSGGFNSSLGGKT